MAEVVAGVRNLPENKGLGGTSKAPASTNFRDRYGSYAVVTQSTNIEKLQRDFVGLANQANEASAQLERGQATSPISDTFQSLLESSGDAALVVSILCLSDRANERMLRWIVGTDADLSLFRESPRKLAIKRLHSHTRDSLTGDTATATRATIDDNWQNVDVFMAAGMDQLRDDAQVYQQFCTAGHVLMVAGDTDEDVGEDDIQLLSNLAGAFDVVWPTVLGDHSDAADGWWRHALFRSHAAALDRLILSPQAEGGGGNVLSQSSSPLRNSLLFERRVRTLHGAVGNLAVRQDRELNSSKLRQSLLASQPKPPSPRDTPSADKQIAQVREQFGDELATLEKEIALKSERATQPLGSLTNLMRENATKLRLEDLDKQQSASLIKLSVNGSHLGAVNRTIEHALRQELTADVVTVRQRLNELVTYSTESLRDAVGESAQFSIPPLSESPIWRTVENLMAIGKESHIELPRKGFFDVLTAGRQKVFILIMFVSLMGRMGLPNLFATGLMRMGFGLFMGTVLIGSMVNAIFVWRREKESQSEKEMAKIKDSLFADGTKVIEQVEKGKLSFIRDYLRDFSKRFDQQLKRTVEEHASSRKADFAARSQRYEATRKMLEAQVKALSDLGRQIDKLADGAKKLHTTTLGEIRDTARQHETVSPRPPDEVESQQPVDFAETADAEQHATSPADESPASAEPAAQPPPTAEPPAPPIADPETKPSRPADGQRPRRRPSALLQRREARQRERLAHQSEAAPE